MPGNSRLQTTVCGSARALLPIACAALLILEPARAFDSPLSEEAVREAYFLGQRHDESLDKFLDKYSQHLPVPPSGLHIASIGVFTPLVQAVLRSSNHVGSYSAQQAQLDHRQQAEMVQVRVIIRLTESYGSFVPAGDSASRTDRGLIPRSSDFWRAFRVTVFDGAKQLSPSSSTGQPDYRCWRGGCALIGATIQLQFPATAFRSQDVTVEVNPPEGDRVSANFALTQLR